MRQLEEYLQLALELERSQENLEAVEEEVRQLLQVAEDCQRLLPELETYIKKCQDYDEYKEMADRSRTLEVQLLGRLKTDRVRQALNYLLDSDSDLQVTIAGRESLEGSQEWTDELLLAALASLNECFTSFAEIEEAYSDKGERFREFREELNEEQRQHQSLQNRLEELATTERLERAQKQIDRARAGLRILAEEYAVYRAAGFILGKVRNRFMEEARDSLLDQASRALEQITGGEYTSILPPEDLTAPDFQASLSDGSRQNTVGILSRGTREQLFLAVRINRIQEIEPPLPVIVDDSLVNFDRRALRNTVDVLANLAETHQVFILTCHPHLVEIIDGIRPDTQYWHLDQGEFSLSTGRDLCGLLQG